jgi:hypothetical protein
MSEATARLALRLKWSMADVRRLLDDLEADGVSVIYTPTTGDLCPACTAHYATEETGFCIRCTTDRKLERQREADEAEEARLREEAVRAVNEQKQERKRMRELYQANPRTKTLRKWIEWLIEEPGRLEAITYEVQSRLEEGAT